MQSKNTSYLSRLDHLRFGAALLVAAYHFHGSTNIPIDTRNLILMLIREGESGVSLFMVLSGFILTRIALGKKIDYKHFVFNRFLRIYPLYIVAVVIDAVSTRGMDVLSFIATVVPIGAIGGVTLGKFSHLWTIAVESQFYLAFPILALFLARYGARYLLGVIALAVVFRIIMYLLNGTIQDGAYYSILGRIDQFSIGMLAAVVFAARPKMLSSPIALCAAILGIYVWFFLLIRWTGGYSGKESPGSVAWIIWPTIDAFFWAIFAVAYMQQNWRTPQTVDRVLSYLGVISFSIYIWHDPIIVAMYLHPSLTPFNAWPVNFLLVVMPTIVAVSSLSYFVIEKPFFAFRTRYVMAPESSASLHVSNQKSPAHGQ